MVCAWASRHWRGMCYCACTTTVRCRSSRCLRGLWRVGPVGRDRGAPLSSDTTDAYTLVLVGVSGSNRHPLARASVTASGQWAMQQRSTSPHGLIRGTATADIHDSSVAYFLPYAPASAGRCKPVRCQGVRAQRNMSAGRNTVRKPPRSLVAVAERAAAGAGGYATVWGVGGGHVLGAKMPTATSAVQTPPRVSWGISNQISGQPEDKVLPESILLGDRVPHA